MSNNFIRVLRNGTLYANREAAISELNTKLSGLQDGEICIASYGATWDAAKTILGVARLQTVDGVAKHSYTIFDNEANSAEIAAEIAKLDKTVTHKDTNNHVTVKIIETDSCVFTTTTQQPRSGGGIQFRNFRSVRCQKVRIPFWKFGGNQWAAE